MGYLISDSVDNIQLKVPVWPILFTRREEPVLSEAEGMVALDSYIFPLLNKLQETQ